MSEQKATDIEIEIDGKTCVGAANAMLIQVADAAGIYIPRFCYHKHLSVAANCRMCLVEVEKMPKAVPACATPIMPGMKVLTRSKKALLAQRAVMEFLLINHPLDCPICDQGGECELQDLSLGFGNGTSPFQENKRAVKNPDIGPLIATEMTRCIQCTRCVRFGDEVAGLRELGAVNRGEHMEIDTYVQHVMHSEVSANIIDLCPVGALTSKPFRFAARAWELSQKKSIAAHDSVGTNVHVHLRNGKVVRMAPRENNALNETWLSDRDRFSYEALYHADRLTDPLIRKEGQWQTVDWETALLFAVEKLQRVLNSAGVDALGALVSPNATLEEGYLLQKLVRAIGSHHIDHRLRQTDMRDQALLPASPQLPFTLTELEQTETIFLIAAHVQKEQPLIGVRLRKAALKGARICAVNLIDYRLNFPLREKIITSPATLIATLAGIAKALAPTETALASVVVDDQCLQFAKVLQTGNTKKILLGAAALNHPQAAEIRQLADFIAEQTGATIGWLTEGANAAGLWLGGVVPHRLAANQVCATPGLTAEEMLVKKRHAYLLLNVEPEDVGNPAAFQAALRAAECVIALSLFKHPVLEQHADVILPIAAFTETAGTFVNAMGNWQSFQGVAQPLAHARPAWKVLRVLANLLQLPHFDYASAEEVATEVKQLVATMNTVANKPDTHEAAKQRLKWIAASLQPRHPHEIVRIGDIPLYAADSLVRRATALQATSVLTEGNLATVRLHPNTLSMLGVLPDTAVTLQQAGASMTLTAIADARVPMQAAWIAGGIPATLSFSELFGTVAIKVHS